MTAPKMSLSRVIAIIVYGIFLRAPGVCQAPKLAESTSAATRKTWRPGSSDTGLRRHNEFLVCSFFFLATPFLWCYNVFSIVE